VTFLATIILPYVASFFVAMLVDRTVYVRDLVERPLDTVLFNIVGITCMLILWFTASRLMRTYSLARNPLRPGRLLGVASTFLGCYGVLAAVCVVWVGRRPMTAADLGRTLLVTAVLFVTLLATARLLAAHRRPYDPWLSLDLAA
jgi:hypothetical protein